MLSKPHRLPLRFFRDRTSQAGKLVSGPLFSFVVASPPERSELPTRFSVIISKKIASSAVARNRLRRQLLHLLAGQLPHLNSGFDVIVLAKPGLATAPNNTLSAEISRLLRRSNLSRA